MDISNLKLKDMWVLIPVLVQLVAIVLWPEFWTAAIRFGLIGVSVIFCTFGGIVWLVTFFAERRAIRLHNLTPQNGNDVSVVLDDGQITVTYKASQAKKYILLNSIGSVYVVALDDFPIGGICYLIEYRGEVVAIPWDADGAEKMLTHFQILLPDFDNNALIESASMLHGKRQIWKRSKIAVPEPIEEVVKQTIPITGRNTP